MVRAGAIVGHDFLESWATAIHASGRQLVLAVTGGGSQAISELLRVPGGSRSVLEAVVPYSEAALVDWLRGRPDQFCSAAASRAMAMAAWMRARRLAPETDPHLLVGLGVTASLASDRPKRGEHRVHVSVQTSRETRTVSVTLVKGARSRSEEERLAAHLVLAVLSDCCGVEQSDLTAATKEILLTEERLEETRQIADADWTRLLLGEITHIVWPRVEPANPLPGAMLAGSFNPPHAGHREMAAIGSEILSTEVAWELSVTNVDKPPLDFCEIARRLTELMAEGDPRPVVLTAAPTFAEKAVLFPGCTFLVGIDTVERIADVRYYGNDPKCRDGCIGQLAAQGCRFLVFGRLENGHFVGLSDLSLPASLHGLCSAVPAERFRVDLSSTQIRACGRQQ